MQLTYFYINIVRTIHLSNERRLHTQLQNTPLKWATYINQSIVHSVDFIRANKFYSYMQILCLNCPKYLNQTFLCNIHCHSIFDCLVAKKYHFEMRKILEPKHHKKHTLSFVSCLSSLIEKWYWIESNIWNQL
jgi:hypothetical protein